MLGSMAQVKQVICRTIQSRQTLGANRPRGATTPWSAQAALSSACLQYSTLKDGAKGATYPRSRPHSDKREVQLVRAGKRRSPELKG